VFIIYLITKELTGDIKVSLFTSLVSSFTPILFTTTFNSISPYSLVIPTIFFGLYFLLKLPKKHSYASYFLLTTFLLAITHPSSFVFILGLIFYLALLVAERLEIRKSELEVILFSTFLVVWLQFILFKKAFLVHGPAVIWQNIPEAMHSQFFTQFTIIDAISQIGIVPLIFGIYMVYRCTFIEKNRQLYLVVGFVASTTLLLWLKLIPINVGLMILGLALVILFGKFMQIFIQYVKRTRFSNFKLIFVACFVMLFVATSVIPTLYYGNATVNNSFSDEEIAALIWIRKNTPKNATVVALPEEGHLITSVAQRKNVMDTDFLLMQDAEIRLADIIDIFTTVSETEAIELLNKYSASYIYFSPRAKSKLGIKSLRFVEPKCFPVVYNRTVEIYKSVCELR